MDALFGVVPHDEEKLRSGQLGAAVAVEHLEDEDETQKTGLAVRGRTKRLLGWRGSKERFVHHLIILERETSS